MLIPLKHAIEKHQMHIRGIVHVGAHYGQEFSDYRSNGIDDIIFIEPCQKAFSRLEQNFKNYPGVKLFHCACAEEEGEGLMYVAPHNEGQSNSLLKPDLHLVHHPEVLFTETEQVTVRKLDDLPFDRTRYNLLMMDTQGAELRVLKGAVKTLPHIDYIYTEVNNQSLYHDNAMVDQLSAFLEDFSMVSVYWVGNKGWGDAIYIRKSLL